MSLTNRAGLAVFGVFGAMGAIQGFTTEPQEGTSFGFRVFFACFLAVVIMGGGFLASTFFSALLCFTAKAKGILGEHTLETTDDGLVEATEYNISMHRWAALRKIKQRNGCLLIYVNDLMAQVVPLRHPLLEGDLEAFVDQLRSRITKPETARGNPPTTPAHPPLR